MDSGVRAMKALVRAAEGLREAGVLRSPDFLEDLGRWFVEGLFGGFRALPGTKRAWHVRVTATGERFRVRTHLYDRARPWSLLEGVGDGYSHLAVVILTPDFRLRDLYKVPRAHIPLQRRKSAGTYYRWSELEPWRVDPATLPGARDLADLL